MHVAPSEIGQRAVEDLLRDELYVRIQGGTDLRGYGSRSTHVQRMADEVAGFGRGRRAIQDPGVAAHLSTLRSGEVAALLQAVRQLLERALRPGRVVPQVHSRR